MTWDMADKMKNTTAACVEDVARAREDLAKLQAEIKRLETDYAAWEAALAARYDALYKAIIKRRDELAKQIAAIPEIPAIHVPYALTEIVTVAERFSRLTPKEWQKVVDLAVAMRRDR